MSKGENDYKRVKAGTPKFKANLQGVGHMGTYMQAKGGKFGTGMWKWLDWTLHGNQTSSQYFVTDGPGSAKADGWQVERQDLDKLIIN